MCGPLPAEFVSRPVLLKMLREAQGHPIGGKGHQSLPGLLARWRRHGSAQCTLVVKEEFMDQVEVDRSARTTLNPAHNNSAQPGHLLGGRKKGLAPATLERRWILRGSEEHN